MKFGKPVLYVCPSCGKSMRQVTYISYTVFGGVRRYSDGKNIGGPCVTPDLAKCPYCGAIFFRHNLKKKRARAMRLDLEQIDTPTAKDLIKALKDGLPQTAEETIQARLDLWRALNDKIRDKFEISNGEFTSRELAVWRKNCEKLLNSLSAKRTGRKQTGSISDKNLVTMITIMELRRNLGQFDECMTGIRELARLREDCAWLEKQFAAQCKKNNIFVFEFVREKKEKRTMPDKKIIERGGKKFVVPKGDIFCENCGTTNFIYDDMEPPYKCDNCKSPLDESALAEIDLDEAGYEREEGRYDGEA